MRTKGGLEVWLYPDDGSDRIRGCVVHRSRYFWQTTESRDVCEWDRDGRYQSTSGKRLELLDLDMGDGEDDGGLGVLADGAGGVTAGDPGVGGGGARGEDSRGYVERQVKKLIAVAVAIGAAIGLAGCVSEADVASQNVSKAADMFEIQRRIVFYNGITGEYMLTIEGLCSLGNYDKAREVSVTCKTGPKEYKKHFLGLSDNVTFFAEQLTGAQVSTYHYRVVFKPSTIVPDLEIK